MGMFFIKKGTIATKVIFNDAAGIARKKIKTANDTVFGKEQLVVDPTGISKYASIPQHLVTIGGAWARAGLYGFVKSIQQDPQHKIIYLFNARDVEYR